MFFVKKKSNIQLYSKINNNIFYQWKKVLIVANELILIFSEKSNDIS